MRISVKVWKAWQDSKAEEEYQQWQQKRWKTEAWKRGIIQPAAVEAFMTERMTAEKKAAKGNGEYARWPMAYRLYLRGKSQTTADQANLYKPQVCCFQIIVLTRSQASKLKNRLKQDYAFGKSIGAQSCKCT